MTKRVISLEESGVELKGLPYSMGAALAERMQEGWSVPAGMVVTTDGCRSYCTRLGQLSDEIMEELVSAIRQLEQQTGTSFGGPNHPLLFDVRSDETVSFSALEKYAISYVGLNDETVEGLAHQTGDRFYALQCYLAVLQQYGHLVHGIPYKMTFVKPAASEPYFSGETELESWIEEWKDLIQAVSGSPFPQDVFTQLQTAVRAVFCSADQMNHGADPLEDQTKEEATKGAAKGTTNGPAVLMQAMVQGNDVDYKGSGKVCTRNPATGEQGMIGDYLPSRSKSGMVHALSYLKRNNSKRYTELEMICMELERRTGTVLELTYVVKTDSVCIQHVQPARLSSLATIRNAVNFVHEGLVSKEEALLRMRSEDIAAGMQQELPELKILLEWADDIKELSILSKVEHISEVWHARAWDAEGVGLCTTETMLLSPSRKPYMQKMLLAETEADRRRGLERLLPMQQSDMECLFEAMDGRPVNIQLFDFPLQELFQDEKVLESQSNDSALVLSQIHEMQLEAIFRAAVKSIRKGLWVRPEIMIPHVEHVQEIQKMRALVDHVADQVLGEERRHCVYKVGAAVTSAKVAWTAAHIARYADFISFDADTLTQSIYGNTREKTSGRELVEGETSQIECNSSHTFSIEGVGRLVEMAAAQGRIRKPHLKTSITGEHILDTACISFIHDIKLVAVCCKPEQIPWARIAAAQAVIRASHNNQSMKNEDISTIA
ncbi:putative PEP-binding protein [Paenibacillus sp. RRE4]|uniref:putative PEP-binding protein n=1 Tax=Paenibacillus sp. RRE4 TaxID=2962587 RepID=UPI00288231E1|nr:putative PEP-binding protein [Paenibacillus sp. RRE4]MDT0122549.1 putative PEP-binding protein [Paenibacillus sp. RRE4]